MDIGHYNQLRIIKQSDQGLILDAGDGDTVILPHSEIPADLQFDPWADARQAQSVQVFVYASADGEPIVTTTKPRVTVGESAVLNVVSRSPAGLWLDWGLPQDLLLPRSEQPKSDSASTGVHPDDENAVFVYVFLDEDTGRICATTRLHRYLAEDGSGFREWQPVDLVIASKTELGFKAIINQQYLGLLYADEVFQTLQAGDQLKGYIKSVRSDGKIDLTLHARPVELKDELGQRILADLNQHGGESPLTDKSPPEAIYKRYQISKKNYKKAIGNLYKARLIVIEDHRIAVVKPKS